MIPEGTAGSNDHRLKSCESYLFFLFLFIITHLIKRRRVAQWLEFRVPGLEQRGAGLIPALCASFWSESARRPGG
jgi:hypothetical protein